MVLRHVILSCLFYLCVYYCLGIYGFCCSGFYALETRSQPRCVSTVTPHVIHRWKRVLHLSDLYSISSGCSFWPLTGLYHYLFMMMMIIIIVIIIIMTIYNWCRNTAMPLQGRLTIN